MRQVTTNVYRYDELSQEAQQTAISQYRDNNVFTEYIFEDAYNTFKKFADLFNISHREIDFLEPYRSNYSFSNIDDKVLELSGQRLATYIWNNYHKDLFKGKYYSIGLTDHCISHKRVKSRQITNNCPNKGKWSNSYYSAITLDNCCVLTGVCYDDDILDPVYNFLNNPTNSDFEDLLNDCISSICKSVQGEYEYRHSDEAIQEDIDCNNYEFTSEGEMI